MDLHKYPTFAPVVPHPLTNDCIPITLEFGAHHVLDPKTYDVVTMSKELSETDGADVVFDCAGVPASIETACRAVKARGTVVNMAIWEREIHFQPNMLVFKEARLAAVLGYQREDFQALTN